MLSRFLFLCFLTLVLPLVAFAQDGAPALPEGLPAWVYVAVPLAVSTIFRLVSVFVKSNNAAMVFVDFLAASWGKARVDPTLQK
jgi:hypothetical protein